MRLNPYLSPIISLIEAGLCGCNELGSGVLEIDSSSSSDCVLDIDVCGFHKTNFDT